MRQKLLDCLRDPWSGNQLALHPFESNTCSNGEIDVVEGLLVEISSEENSHSIYPILHGVPVMLKEAMPSSFLEKHRQTIETTIGSNQHIRGTDGDIDWSFSNEWNNHFDNALKKTWGWSIEQRKQQAVLELNITEDWLLDKTILDAGCGNGQLSNALCELGCRVIALDFSSSVYRAEENRQNDDVHYVRGDLQHPPFAACSFDGIVSNGVLHHTPDTYKTFENVSGLVKANGLFYLWLYHRPQNFFKGNVIYPILDSVRYIVARLPHKLQYPVVKLYAAALWTKSKVLKRNQHMSWKELVISAYDTMTPRWCSYHTPGQVASWFHQCGFSAPTLTHWDNPYGFGLVAKRCEVQSEAHSHVPGIHFGATTECDQVSA